MVVAGCKDIHCALEPISIGLCLSGADFGGGRWLLKAMQPSIEIAECSVCVRVCVACTSGRL